MVRDSNCRLYIEPNSEYLTKPFGLGWLEDFILQNEIEKKAVRFCIERLWCLHAGMQSISFYFLLLFKFYSCRLFWLFIIC